MHYYEDTIKMLSLYDEEGANAMVNFYAQLSQIRAIYVHAIVIAINSKDTDFTKTLRNSITRESWMGEISLCDIRNQVIFTMVYEHNCIIASEPYVDSTCEDAVYLSFDRISTIGEHIKNLGVLIETCYYVRQINIIKNNRGSITKEWRMYHDFIAKNTLSENVYFVYTLLKPIMLQ